MRGVTVLLCASAAVFMSGCATTPGGQRLAEKDPLEGFNRSVWGFNRALDTVALKPATTVYKTVTPTAARRGVRNVFNNADEPLSFINALLQGKVGRAFHTLGRFIVNTTIGVGGLADHATSMGLDEKPEDFGQTLAVWGVNAGPYIVLPLLGPSTLRDGVGFGVEFVGDPARIALRKWSGLTRTQRYGITALETIDLRADLMEMGADNVLDTSLDPYATARSAYLQRRTALINDQDSAGGGEQGLDPADFETGADGATSAPAGAGQIDPQDFEVSTETTPPAGTKNNADPTQDSEKPSGIHP